jgi:hypothetical protein
MRDMKTVRPKKEILGVSNLTAARIAHAVWKRKYGGNRWEAFKRRNKNEVTDV